MLVVCMLYDKFSVGVCVQTAASVQLDDDESISKH